jgi:hypothetical protein
MLAKCANPPCSDSFLNLRSQLSRRPMRGRPSIFGCVSLVRGEMTVRLTREGTVATNRDWQMRYVMPSCRTQLSEPEEWGIHSHR